MTLESVLKEAKESIARCKEKQEAEPDENFQAWVEVPPGVFTAVLAKAKDTPETKEILKSFRKAQAAFPGVNHTVLAEQFVAIAGV